MYVKKNDFIVLNRTECYFIDWVNMVIGIGRIIAYDNINRQVTIEYKLGHNNYILVYRSRDYIWFRLEYALQWFNDYLKDYGMVNLKIQDLSSQLDGVRRTFTLTEYIGENYTIFLNGLRQDREDFIVDEDNHTITMNTEYIPNEDDTLSIEYLSTAPRVQQ